MRTICISERGTSCARIQSSNILTVNTKFKYFAAIQSDWPRRRCVSGEEPTTALAVRGQI